MDRYDFFFKINGKLFKIYQRWVDLELRNPAMISNLELTCFGVSANKAYCLPTHKFSLVSNLDVNKALIATKNSSYASLSGRQCKVIKDYLVNWVLTLISQNFRYQQVFCQKIVWELHSKLVSLGVLPYIT